MSINDKNALPIRPRMDVYVSLVDYGNTLEADLKFRNYGQSAVTTVQWPNVNHASYGFGYPTGMFSTAQNFLVDIDEINMQNIPSVYILAKFTGTWTVGWDGATQVPLEPMMLLSMGSPGKRLRFTEMTSGDLTIWIIPVLDSTLCFGNENLISATLNLASSLNVFEPTFEVSTIEASAYITGLDLADLINLPDRAPIVYISGYAGDELSFPRFFYLEGQPEYENNKLTFTGEDASALLETYQVPAQVIQYNDGLIGLYGVMKNTLAAAGIITVAADPDPASYSPFVDGQNAIIKQQTGREFFAEVMSTCRYKTNGSTPESIFWPTFVDAGKPEVRWKYIDEDSPLYGPFDIYEADIGDHKPAVEQAVRVINSDDDFGLSSYVYEVGTSATIATVAVRAGRQYSQSFQQYYRSVSVTRSTTPRKYTATSATWKAASAGNSVISGILQDIAVNVSSMTNSSVSRGRTVTHAPKIYGQFLQVIDNNLTEKAVPDYASMFDLSTETGSFTWRGNPLMQPRDPFYFHRLDNTVEVCTVERIELTHEEGGTSAVIHYRKGVC